MSCRHSPSHGPSIPAILKLRNSNGKSVATTTDCPRWIECLLVTGSLVGVSVKCCTPAPFPPASDVREEFPGKTQRALISWKSLCLR